MKIGVCESNYQKANQIVNWIESGGLSKKYVYAVNVFYSHNYFLRHLKQAKDEMYSILILYLDDLNEDMIRIQEILKQCGECQLILVTKEKGLHKQGFMLGSSWMFEGEIEYEEFLEGFTHVLVKYEKMNPLITMKRGHGNVILDLSKIQYFESKLRIVEAVSNDRKVDFYGRLDDIEVKLGEAGYLFVRINRSYLVNPFYVEQILLTKIIMKSGMVINITRTKGASVRNKLVQYFE